jgi:uncharacterized protein with ATP-grasp and redox domains
MTSTDEGARALIVKKTIKKLATLDFSLPPPLMAKEINSYAKEISGNDDPYRSVKDESTSVALKLYPFLKTEVEKSEKPFECAVRLAIAGNIIDFGANHHFKLESIHQVISEALLSPIDLSAVKKLEEAVSTSSRILYIADNAGEFVFDRLLLGKIPGKITVAVRGFPILNDVTRREAAMSELDTKIKIIDTGDSVPGVFIETSSEEFKKNFFDADLIIAKGQGNYETLDETKQAIFFLLKAKCAVIAEKLGAEQGSLQIISKNI